MGSNSTARRRVLFALKTVVMAVLLAWMVGQIEWRDYAVVDGGSRAVVDADPSYESPQRLLVQRGPLWNRTVEWQAVDEHVQPVAGGGVIRPGLASSIKHLRPGLLIAGLLVAAIPTVLVALRWRLLLGVQGIHLAKLAVVRLAFLGSFFDGVFPGAIGGDLVKAYCVAKGRPRKSGVLVSLVIDRFFGVCGLTALAAVTLAVVAASRLLPAHILMLPAVSIGAIAVGIAVLAALILSSRIRSLRIWNLFQHIPFAHHLLGFGEAAALYRHSGGVLVRAALLTFGGHALTVLSVILLALALRIPAPWYLYVLCVPLITIISAVPLTPGGVGVVENLYIIFLASVGNPSIVLALALLVRLSWIVTALPGAAFAVGGLTPLPAGAIRHELLDLSDDVSAPAGPQPSTPRAEA